jgi:hypothetical protein
VSPLVYQRARDAGKAENTGEYTCSQSSWMEGWVAEEALIGVARAKQLWSWNFVVPQMPPVLQLKVAVRNLPG